MQTRHSTGAVRERRVWDFSGKKRLKSEKSETHRDLKRAKQDKNIDRIVLPEKSPRETVNHKGQNHASTERSEEKERSADHQQEKKTYPVSNREIKQMLGPKEINVCSSLDNNTDKTQRLLIEKLELDKTEKKQIKLVIPYAQEEQLFSNLKKTIDGKIENSSLFSLIQTIQGEFVGLDDGSRAVKVPEIEQENEIILIAVTNTTIRVNTEHRDCETQTEEDETLETPTVSDGNDSSTEIDDECSGNKDKASSDSGVRAKAEKSKNENKNAVKKSNDKCWENKDQASLISGVRSKAEKSKRENKNVLKKSNQLSNNTQETKKISMTRPVIKTKTESCVELHSNGAERKTENPTNERLNNSKTEQEIKTDKGLAQRDYQPESDSGNNGGQRDDTNKRKDAGGLCDSSIKKEYNEHSYGVKNETNEQKDLKCEPLVKNHACSYCGKSFKLKRDLVIHVRSHTGERPYLCTVCNKAFSQKSILKGHMRIHTGEKPFVCDHCGKAFRDATTLKVHVRFHTGERPYKCQYCDRVFVSSSARKSHMTKHTGEKKYMCHLCGKGFAISNDFKSHLRVHTGEKLYACKECGRRFHSTRNRRRHMAVHTGNRKYFMCELCGKSIASSTNFTKHMKIHLTEKPHVCEICDKKFRDKKCFKNHVKAHAERDPFVCSICGKNFVLMSHLKRHLLTHQENTVQLDVTASKVYACNFCDRQYKNRHSFKRHHKSHPEAQNIIYKCVVCDETFETLAFLEEHVTLHDHIKHEESEEVVSITEKLASGNVYRLCNGTFSKYQTVREHLQVNGAIISGNSDMHEEGVIVTSEQTRDGGLVKQEPELEHVPDSGNVNNHVEHLEQVEGEGMLVELEHSGQIEQIIEGNCLEHIDHLEEVDHIEHVIIEDESGQPSVQTIVYVTMATEDIESSQ